MKDETLYQAFQALFFACWHAKDNKREYTEKLHALCELGDHVWSNQFKIVREGFAWLNWQERYNDPKAVLPAQVFDDSLLQSITLELLINCTFHARGDWYIHVEGRHGANNNNNNLDAIRVFYHNRVTEANLLIGTFFGDRTTNMVLELNRHIRFIEGTSNPMTAHTE